MGEKADRFRKELHATFSRAQEAGCEYVDVRSGDLAKATGIVGVMPSCCGVMRKEMAPGDQVLYSPPKGKGTRLIIRYFLPRPVESTAAAPGDLAVPPPEDDPLSEDALKRVIAAWLNGDGWQVQVAEGRAHGIDVDARRGNERWIIEVKGRGSRAPMNVNYFLGVLGTILQRMDDPSARYSVALPDTPQFTRLWAKLPILAKHRTGITALVVNEEGSVTERQ